MFSTILINLDRDIERLAHMRAQLEREGIAFERFPAVLGAAMPSELRSYFPATENGRGFLSNGELGCYASHLAIYEAIADGRIASPALVIEDDIALPPNTRGLIEDILRNAPPGWDLIRLSTPAKRAYFTVAELTPPHALVQYSMSSGSTGALLVSASGARKFTDRAVLRDAPIDQDMRQVWRFNLDMYGVVPQPFGANVLEGSSIDEMSTTTRSREDGVRQRELRRRRRLGRRHQWNVAKFGVAAWAASEVISAVVSVVGKRARPAFLARTGRWLQALAARAASYPRNAPSER